MATPEAATVSETATSDTWVWTEEHHIYAVWGVSQDAGSGEGARFPAGPALVSTVERVSRERGQGGARVTVSLPHLRQVIDALEASGASALTLDVGGPQAPLFVADTDGPGRALVAPIVPWDGSGPRP